MIDLEEKKAAAQIAERKLWAALSYVFVDSELDIQSIVEVAKHYPIKDIEFALFERVGPVCITNMMTPAPPVWWFFNEEELFSDIELLIEKRSRQDVVGKCVSALVTLFIRFCCRAEWADIQSEIEKAKTVSVFCPSLHANCSIDK